MLSKTDRNPLNPAREDKKQEKYFLKFKTDNMLRRNYAGQQLMVLVFREKDSLLWEDDVVPILIDHIQS